MHTVIRSHYRTLRRHKKELSTLLNTQCKYWAIKLYKVSINSNHIHLATKVEHRDDYKNFIRTFSALSARLVTGAKKGKKLSKKFWALKPFSRIVEWGRAINTLLNYITQNQFEAEGQIAYVPRKPYLTG